jgi:hypothetical protein
VSSGKFHPFLPLRYLTRDPVKGPLAVLARSFLQGSSNILDEQDSSPCPLLPRSAYHLWWLPTSKSLYSVSLNGRTPKRLRLKLGLRSNSGRHFLLFTFFFAYRQITIPTSPEGRSPPGFHRVDARGASSVCPSSLSFFEIFGVTSIRLVLILHHDRLLVSRFSTAFAGCFEDTSIFSSGG